jgi:hypothetical protein
MIRFALVVFALSLLWPSPPVAGPVVRTSGTLTAEHDESNGGIRLTGGFELGRRPAAAGLDRSGPIGRPLRRSALPAVAPVVRRASAYRAGPSGSTLRGAHPFFDSTAPPLA